MWNKIKNWLNINNRLLWISIIALVLLGLCGMYFVGPYESARFYLDEHFFFRKFLPFAIVGIILLFALSKLSKKWIVRIAWVLGIFSLILMLITVFCPHYVHGASRYVFIFGAPINPYILMLPAYIILMSNWLSNEKANKTRTMIGTTALTLFIVFAAFLAPYIFMAQVYTLLFVIIGISARKNFQGVFYTSIAIVIAFVLALGLGIALFPHVQHRIMDFGNYASHISTYAITTSALVGNTPESLAALPRLPNLVSDFMFTGIIAKFGMLMGLLTLVIYGCIATILARMSKYATDKFNKIMNTGTLGLFAIFVLIGLAVAFGLLSTAAYWPFISFGGTMFLAWCTLFGFVLSQNKK